MIKMALCLPPWMPHAICYKYIKFEDIITRLKRLSIKFINKNRGQDELIRNIVELTDKEDSPDSLVKNILRSQ